MADDTSPQPSASRPILIAVDFSPDSNAAIDWGLNQAILTGAPVILFHAIHDNAEAPGFYSRDGGAGLTRISDVAREMMDALVADLAPKLDALAAPVEIGTALIEGLPSGRIVEAAEQAGARLIVLGSGGRSTVATLLLGSVAENVIKKSRIPVVVVPADRDADGPAQDVTADD